MRVFPVQISQSNPCGLFLTIQVDSDFEIPSYKLAPDYPRSSVDLIADIVGDAAIGSELS